MTGGMVEQIPMFYQDSWSGKTSPAHSAPTTAKTSAPSWKKLRGSQNQTLLFLDMREGDGTMPELLSVTDTLLRGELSTLSTGERPSVGVASLWSPTSMAYSPRRSCLSEVLEENPDPRYTLSARACQGILNRADRRGKKLPEILRAALERQANPCASGTTTTDGC